MKFPSPSSADSVISISNVTRKFGDKHALNDVSLYTPRGAVFGLVGENGAGKTTLIKHILGLLRPQTGSVKIFGRDPVQNPAEVLKQIGYLSEQPDLPGWMRVDEFVRYTKAFYPSWDSAYAEELRVRFGLEPSAKLRNLSKGQQAKAGLLAAQAHRPKLLLLDEPSSGLDPVVRRDILEAVVRTVADEGRTVFFSSHLLEEIERVCDCIAMLHKGELVFFGSLDEVKSRYRQFILHFKQEQPATPIIRGSLRVSGSGREWTVLCNGSREQLPHTARALGAEIVSEHAPSLSEIFVALAS